MQRWMSAEREWLPLAPLVLLPLTWALPPQLRALASILILLATMLIWALPVLSSTEPGAAAVLARSQSKGRIEAWELLLLAFVVAASVVYVVVGWRLDEITFNDGAYYYGVARHMARTGRFEEPIVWHFLHQPDTILHAPFDYWGCLTSLLLVPPMLVFGVTLSTAFLTMSAIAALTLLAFWYLICVALPLRYRATQLIALVIFAFTPAMDVYRFQPESIPVAQLFILLALIAFCLRRGVAAVLCGFCILLARGDGLILFTLIFLAVLFREWSDGDGQRRRLWLATLAGCACMGVYVVWSLVSFGTLTPPAPQKLPFLPVYKVVFDFDVPHQRSWRQMLSWFTWDYVSWRIMFAFRALRAIPFTPAFDCWLAIAMVPVLSLFRLRARPQALIWVLCFGGYFFVAWVSGPGFAPGRTPYTFTPLIVLAGALGIDAILRWFHVWSERGSYVRVKSAFLGAGGLALCFFFLVSLPVLQTPSRYSNLSYQKNLMLLAPTLGSEPVATNIPWYMIAYTDSPTISIPMNGEAAIEAAFAQYQIRWLVLFQFPFQWAKSRTDMFGASRPVFYGILDGNRTRIGRYELKPVSVRGVLPAVYRVELAKGALPRGSTF